MIVFPRDREWLKAALVVSIVHLLFGAAYFFTRAPALTLPFLIPGAYLSMIIGLVENSARYSTVHLAIGAGINWILYTAVLSRVFRSQREAPPEPQEERT